MARPTVRVEGARRLRKTLKEAGDDFGDLKAAHAEAARIAADASADLAPARTGRLRADIRSSGTKTEAVVRAGRKSVPYAGPIHWGWKKRNIRPNPFISRGAVDSEGRWLPVYATAVDDIIEKVEGA